MGEDLASLKLRYTLSNEVGQDIVSEFIESQDLNKCACRRNCHGPLETRNIFEMLDDGEIDITCSYKNLWICFLIQ